MLVVWAAGLLASCGGGDTAGPAQGAEGTRARALAVTSQQAALAQWAPSIPLPIVPVAAAVLSSGKLLMWSANLPTDSTAIGHTLTVLFDPATGTLTQRDVTETGHDMFCPGTARLPDGRLLINGGYDSGVSTIYDPSTDTWTSAGAMSVARGYNASVPLADGSVLTMGGSWSGGINVKPAELYTPAGGWRSLSGITTADTTLLTQDLGGLYRADNHMWLIPTANGRVLHAGPSTNMHWLNVSGNGSVTPVGTRADDSDSMNGNAVAYDTGKVLTVGGATSYDATGAKSDAFLIDTNSGVPVVRRVAAMAYPRTFANSVVLPNGQVVVIGGQTYSTTFSDTNAVLSPELFDPQTESFTVLPAMKVPRTYHSVAVLLPDARVVSGGGGLCGGCGNDHLDIQILSPPYLFNADGSAATRPAITAAPTTVGYGTTMSVSTDSTVTAFSMIRLGAATHTVNNDQRRVSLSFTAGAGNSYQVAVPTNPGILLPGQWMLFAMNANGTPSVATIVTVSSAGAPVVQNPGDISVGAGQAVSIAINASTPSGTLAFSAMGLPAGLAIDPVSGAISGTPTVSGSFVVTVLANNGTQTTSTDVLINIAAAAPSIQVLSLPAPVAASGTLVSYAPVLSGGAGAQFSWNFGDGSASTALASSAAASYTYAAPGVYNVTLTIVSADGSTTAYRFLQTIYNGSGNTALARASSTLALETRAGASTRVWVVNADNNSVSVFDTAGNTLLAEIPVGKAPRSLALAADGRVWVVNRTDASISIISPSTLAVVQTLALPRASQPFGIVFSPADGSAFVTLEATGQLAKLDGSSGATLSTLALGNNPRHLSINSGGTALYVSRFISRPLPGEGTAAVSTTDANGNPLGGEVLVVNASSLTLVNTLVLANSTRADTSTSGRGLPNYLGAPALSPDGASAWVPSKQDNILRGSLRDGNALNFQNTVRSISSRIDLVAGSEDLAGRIDHDNAGVASAAVYHPTGAYLFVALETNRQVAVIDVAGKKELFRYEVGMAPQGLAVSADGLKLYVNNFMGRTVSVIDLVPLVSFGQVGVSATLTLDAVASDKVGASQLRGKQLFYDARDPRLARDSYMSCASCHNEGGNDGRTWDFTGQGEGLRNTIALNGRGGRGEGFMHWSANFDEVQDFEGQIRSLAGGTGLMDDANFNTGTRSQPLGQAKAGISPDLDALASYVNSLSTFARSPYRNADGTLTAAAVAGQAVFVTNKCALCHGGTNFTYSGDATMLQNIGTIKPSSGTRLGATLPGIDIPTLRDVWATAPYLHDGSAAGLSDAVLAHSGTNLSATDLATLTEYLLEIGSEEPAPPPAGIAPPATAVSCANNFGTCTLPAGPVAYDVYFGGNGRFAMKSGVSGSIACNPGNFGGDPAFGAAKTCSYANTVPPANAVICSAEWSTCTLPPGTVATVYFGGNGTFALKSGVTLGLACNLNTFGGDPAFGFPKACSYVVTSTFTPTPVPPANSAVCASDGGNCSVPFGTVADVYYGSNGKFVLKSGVSGSIACNVATFGSDPNPGTADSCSFFITSSPVLPASAVACASSWGTCVVPLGTVADVYFGGNGNFARISGATGSVLCGPTRFGGDPAVGYVKACSYVATGTTLVPPDTAISCASIWGTCVVPLGTVADVYFGGNGSFKRLSGATGSITCGPNPFGGDPAVGYAKACSYVATGTTLVPPDTAISCANIWGTCVVPLGTVADVYFGGNGGFKRLSGATGSITCGPNPFGGDPAVGYAKACSYVATGTALVPPDAAISCASNWGTCAVPLGTVADVYFGGNGSFAKVSGATGNIACNPSKFGGDPAVGYAKACSYVPTGTALVPPTPAVSCASNGGTCVVPAGSVADVYFGGNGSFVRISGAAGSIACNPTRFGGDPAVGYAKTCSYVVTG